MPNTHTDEGPVEAVAFRLAAHRLTENPVLPALAPGGVVVTNDSYLGGTHLNDVTLIYPIFDGDIRVFFAAVRDHAHPFFAGAHSDGPMWCLSLPRGAAFNEPDTLVEWAGARVWWRTDADARTVHARARAHQGFAASFGGPEAAPTPAPIAKYMRRLKAAFDPAGILNPGAMTDAH